MDFNDFDHENGVDDGDDDLLLHKVVRDNDDFFWTDQSYGSVPTTTVSNLDHSGVPS